MGACQANTAGKNKNPRSKVEKSNHKDEIKDKRPTDQNTDKLSKKTDSKDNTTSPKQSFINNSVLEEKKKIDTNSFNGKTFSFIKEKKSSSFTFYHERKEAISHITSSEENWAQTLKNYINSSHQQLCYQILSLDERDWIQENIYITNKYLQEKEPNSFFQKKYLETVINLQEHFNWLTWALSYIVNTGNARDLGQYGLPKQVWTDGFEWKGVHVQMLFDEKKRRKVKNEINALKLLYFDYFQIILFQEKNGFGDSKGIRNELLFPFLSYSEFGGKFLVCSACFTKIENVGSIWNYSREGIDMSPLLKRINEKNLLKVEKGYLLIHKASEIIPNLISTDPSYLSSDIGCVQVFKDQTEHIQLNTINLNEFYNVEYESCEEGVKYKVIKKKSDEKDNRNSYNNDFINNKFIWNSLKCITNLMKNENLSDSKSKNGVIEKSILSASVIHKGPGMILYYVDGKNLKIKYPLINSDVAFNGNYFVNSNFFRHLEYFSQVLLKIERHIQDIENLDYYFEKYGINKVFKMFVLSKFSHKNNVTELIQIDILSKLMVKVVKKRYSLEFLYSQSQKSAAVPVYKKIIYEMIQALFNPSVLTQEQLNQSYSLILNKLYFYLLRFNRISGCMFNTPQGFEVVEKISAFFSSMISLARKRPLIFIKQIEKKLNIVIDPFVKYKLSISVDGFNRHFCQDHITESEPFVKSYVDCEMISYYFLVKSISSTSGLVSYEQEKELLNNIQNPDVDNFDNFSTRTYANNPNINRGIVPNNFGIMNLAHTPKKAPPLPNDNRDNTSIIAFDGIIELEYRDIGNKSDITNFLEASSSFAGGKPQENPKKKQSISTVKYQKITWGKISNYFPFRFPPNLYKMNYDKSPSKNNLYSSLSNAYSVKNREALENWRETLSVFEKIISVSPKTSYTLINMYLFLFMDYYFLERDYKKAKETLNKIKEINSNIIYHDIIWLIIINLIEGIYNDSFDYLNSKDSYAKSLIYLLFAFGDPRGRFNYGFDLMMLPTWKLGRYVIIMESNPFTLEYFREFFHSSSYLFKKKLKVIPQRKKNEFFLMDDIIKTFFYNGVIKKSKNKDDDISNYDEEIAERPSLFSSQIKETSNSISENNYSEEVLVKNQQIVFPPMNYSTTPKASNQEFFRGEKFVIFLFKQIQSMLSSSRVYYSSKYLENLGLIPKKPFRNDKKLRESQKFNNILTDSLDYRKNFQNGIIISWGSNKNCQTSHEHYKFLSLPRCIYKLKDIKVIKIACGSEHNLCLSDEHQVFSWGDNHNGQCGTDNEEETISDPLMIKELRDEEVIDIACGAEHSLACNEKGKVFSWGSSEDGVLGTSIKKNECIPIEIPFFSNNQIKIDKVVSSSIHNLALDKDGAIYSWGSSKGGECGVGVTDSPITEPRKIESLKEKIAAVACGEAHSMALTTEGEVYVWGYGFNGQLGLGFCEDTFERGEGKQSSTKFIPVKLDTFGKGEVKIKKISCGKTFSAFITNKDELFTCGENDVYQLGFDREFQIRQSFLNSSCCHCVFPTKVESFLHMQVIKVACGESHCVAMVKDQVSNVTTLFSWGNNNSGQLGQGDEKRTSKPRPINYFLHYKDCDVIDISAGDSHSLCLIKSRDSNSSLEENNKRLIYDTVSYITSTYL